MTALPAEVGEMEEVYGYITFTPPPPFKVYLPLVMRGAPRRQRAFSRSD